MLNALLNPALWQEFYAYKVSCGHLNQKTLRELEVFIQQKEYLPTVLRIQQGGTFGPPKKSEISKLHSGKKRTVYTYAPEENWVLKLLSYQLHRKYDRLFAENLYSFRRYKGVKDAIRKLTDTPKIRRMWSYKAEISNYFNSIPVERLLPLLEQTLADERDTYLFLESLLRNPIVSDHGVLHPEEKGIMAGTPISTFLANLYLSPMDHRFKASGILYARYSDDIILFAETKESLEHGITLVREHLSGAGLSINPEKEAIVSPGQMWTFLGICYRDGIVDVSPVSVNKLKGKMRRKCRALQRWQAHKGATGEQAAKAFVRVFNRKLFENPVQHELTWARWYFPLITTAESLKVIDEYAQSCIRYLATGTHTKAAYNFRYKDMKELGYMTLVNRYYKHASENSDATYS